METKLRESEVEEGQCTYNTIKRTLTRILGSPYYETDTTIIFNGDCVEMLNKIDFSFIDLTITSPPYNIGKEYESTLSVEKYIEWSRRWIENVYSTTNSNGAMLLNVGYLSLQNIARAIPISYLIWDKIQFYLNQEIVWNYGAGVACKNYLSPRNEKVLWYVKNKDDFVFNLDPIRDKNIKYPHSKKNGKLRVNTLGKNPSDVWQIAKVTTGKNRSSKERTPHPCQFPIDLVDRGVLGFSHRNSIVFDPFVGSGSTLESCINHNRFCIGIEIREDYCEIAKKRIENYVSLRQHS